MAIKLLKIPKVTKPKKDNSYQKEFVRTMVKNKGKNGNLGSVVKVKAVKVDKTNANDKNKTQLGLTAINRWKSMIPKGGLGISKFKNPLKK